MKRNVYIKPHHSVDEEAKFKASEEDLAAVSKELRNFVIIIAEAAFRRYSKAHGATNEVEDLEWSRFKKILQGML